MLEQAIEWVSDLEAQVLESGTELAPNQLIDARLAGVKEPARIRLLVAREIPVPQDVLLRAANHQFQLVSATGAGLTVGYAVILREGNEHKRHLLVHEFVHVGQYERMGVEGFLQEYLTQVIRNGYEGSPMEHEAKRRAQAILGPNNQG